jgi:hypothetical protein
LLTGLASHPHGNTNHQRPATPEQGIRDGRDAKHRNRIAARESVIRICWINNKMAVWCATRPRERSPRWHCLPCQSTA